MPNWIKAQRGKVEIFIYDEIDDFGFTAADLQEQLKDVSTNTEIEIRINSIGGDVFDGLAIYNTLRRWKGKVTTIVDGVAASIAAVIFLAGDERQIADNGMVMIHNPLFEIIRGTSKRIEDRLDLIKKAEENLNSIYNERTTASSNQVNEWLEAEETWFSAKEAVDSGIATSIVSLPEITAKANVEQLVAKLNTRLHPPQGDQEMNFEQWLKAYCDDFGVAVDSLTDEQKKKLKAKFDEEEALRAKARTTPPPRRGTDPPSDPSGDGDDLEAKLKSRRQREADEDDRLEAIDLAAKQFSDVELNEDYLKDELKVSVKTVRGLKSHAIRENWSADRFELECRRASRPDTGHVAIHSRERDQTPDEVLSCALLRAAGVPGNGQVVLNKELAQRGHKGPGILREYGYEHMFDDKTLNASDTPELRNISLCQMLEMAIVESTGMKARSRLGSPGFISECRNAMTDLRFKAATGNTTWTGLNIFDDVANKALWAAYDSIPSTWQEWVKQMPVNDFKTHNTYRLTMTGGYRQIGADGELKHGGFTDDKYTHSAGTYGQIVGLARNDIINDDLGALNGIMAALGIGGAQFLEELFYVHLLNRITNLFPTADTNNNYISGAGTDLGVDGLTTAEQKAADHVDGNNRPIMMPTSLILVGSQDSVVASELFTQLNLQGVQTANQKKIPDQNPHIGKWRPVMSPYHNNTQIKRVSIGTAGNAIPNQTSDHWILVRPAGPQGGLVIGSFLNGVTRPTIENADAPFDVLGLQWRAYHDAGADDGDPKWGVFSKGAA